MCKNKMLRFTYYIASDADDAAYFPTLCVVNLFDRLQMRNGIAIKFYSGLPNADEEGQIIASFSQRRDVNFYCNRKYGGMLFEFKRTINSNTEVLPLLQADSIDTQYILLTNQSAVEFLTTNWNISVKKLIRNDIAKFVCSINQDHDLELYFSAKYYEIHELESELMNWERTICQITGMPRMKRKELGMLGTPRVVEVMLY